MTNLIIKVETKGRMEKAITIGRSLFQIDLLSHEGMHC